jgi:hypothetical protein
MPVIQSFEGPLGSGKTMGALEKVITHQLEDPRYWLVSNVEITDDRIRHEDLELEEVLVAASEAEPFRHEYIDFLFDEGYLISDNRNALEEKSKVFSYFLAQVRKRHSNVYYTTPSSGEVDIRLRQITQPKVECARYEADEFFEVVGTIPADFNTNPEIRELAEELCWVQCLDTECTSRHVQHYDVIYIARDGKEFPAYDYWILNPEDYFNLYRSFAMLAPTQYMNQDKIAKLRGRITNLGGDVRPAFIMRFPKLMREDDPEFQEKIYRPFERIKNSLIHVDFELQSNGNGQMTGVKWRGIKLDSEKRMEIEELIKAIKAPEPIPQMQVAPSDEKWKKMFAQPSEIEAKKYPFGPVERKAGMDNSNESES